MPSPPLPPYDVIIFIAVWAITGVSWAISCFTRTRGYCCACAPENGVCTVLCGQASSSSSDEQKRGNSSNGNQMTPISNNNNDDEKLGGSGDAALRMLEEDAAKQQYNTDGTAAAASASPNQQQEQQNSTDDSSSTSATTYIYRAVSSLILSFLIAFILTMIIMAILGGVGFLDALLFSPAAASTCSASCTYTTKDGISGWVDESCCTYSPTGLDTKKDVYLKFRNPSRGNSLSDFVLHGWVMYNSTRHYSAPSSQKPLVLMYNHGSGNNVAAGYRIERYKFLLETGNVIILSYDYAGYGKSTGEAGTESVLASAKGAARYLELYFSSFTSSTDLSFVNYQQSSSTSGVTAGSDVPLGASLTDPLVVDLPANNGGVDMSEIVILGRSLGGAVTTYTATKSSTSQKPKAMILQSTFSRMQDLAAYYFPMFYWAWSAFYSTYDDFDNVANIKNYVSNKCLYHAHSKEDEWVPFSQAEEVQDAAKTVISSGCSQWVVVDNAIHTQPLTDKERETLV